MKDFTPFQNYKVQGGPNWGRRHLPLLREAMASYKIDMFIIPHEDEYQNEYLPECNERLMWATGFSGSAGAAIIARDKAVVFVDGRYTLQVEAQVDETLFEYARLEGSGLANWLAEHVETGDVIGYDPRLHSPKSLIAIRKAVQSAGGELKALSTNPIDTAWTDRPAPPAAPVTVFPMSVAGEDHASKRARIADIMSTKSADFCLLTSPSSIAWLLNIRGGDVMCTPLPLSTVLLHADGQVELFINPVKLSDTVRSHLGNQVSIFDEDAVEDRLKSLKGQSVLIDPSSSSAWHFDTLRTAKANIISGDDPVALPKACKNAAEIAGTTEAHKRDAVALINFLHWLDTDAQSGEYDEIQAAQKLERFRHETNVLKDLSFESISGAGSNGAIVHYRVSEATTKKLEKGSLFLIDSGGQYVDGTTDVTRTIPIGDPSTEIRQRFTWVLKGHIALAEIRFPEGTTGSNLDVLARASLWAQGLDYDHGTGHGVGVFLGVHEGPQRISKTPNSIALRPGMIVSNEPGYYKTGAYGIRIENLQYVTEPKAISGGERMMMGFETLTLAPLHKKMIDISELSARELHYINNYHKRVWKEISPALKGAVKEWLKTACAPI